MNDRAAVHRGAALDVSGLPSYGFSHRSLMWWGTAGLMAIEGMVFAITLAAFVYLRTRTDHWPPGASPPDLLWGATNTGILLVSLLPNHWTKRAAEREDLFQVRIGLFVCLAFATAFLLVRILEFQSLNVRWDSNAYGSALWMLLVLHTVHLLADAFEPRCSRYSW